MRLFDDTQPTVEKVYVQMLSEAPTFKKVEMVDRLHQTGIDMVRAGVQRRHPNASPQETRWHVARLLHGKTIADRVFSSGLR